MKRSKSFYIERITAIIAAVILLQTLFFKFSAAEESVYIFSKLGIEPYGRIGTGVLELITAGLLFNKKTSIYGALMALMTMFGAVWSHLFVIGVEVQQDGGKLFALAVLVLLSVLINILVQRSKWVNLLKFNTNSSA